MVKPSQKPRLKIFGIVLIILAVVSVGYLILGRKGIFKKEESAKQPQGVIVKEVDMPEMTAEQAKKLAIFSRNPDTLSAEEQKILQGLTPEEKKSLEDLARKIDESIENAFQAAVKADVAQNPEPLPKYTLAIPKEGGSGIDLVEYQPPKLIRLVPKVPANITASVPSIPQAQAKARQKEWLPGPIPPKFSLETKPLTKNQISYSEERLQEDVGDLTSDTPHNIYLNSDQKLPDGRLVSQINRIGGGTVQYTDMPRGFQFERAREIDPSGQWVSVSSYAGYYSLGTFTGRDNPVTGKERIFISRAQARPEGKSIVSTEEIGTALSDSYLVESFQFGILSPPFSEDLADPQADYLVWAASIVEATAWRLNDAHAMNPSWEDLFGKYIFAPGTSYPSGVTQALKAIKTKPNLVPELKTYLSKLLTLELNSQWPPAYHKFYEGHDIYYPFNALTDSDYKNALQKLTLSTPPTTVSQPPSAPPRSRTDTTQPTQPTQPTTPTQPQPQPQPTPQPLAVYSLESALPTPVISWQDASTGVYLKIKNNTQVTWTKDNFWLSATNPTFPYDKIYAAADVPAGGTGTFLYELSTKGRKVEAGTYKLPLEIHYKAPKNIDTKIDTLQIDAQVYQVP